MSNFRFLSERFFNRFIFPFNKKNGDDANARNEDLIPIAQDIKALGQWDEELEASIALLREEAIVIGGAAGGDLDGTYPDPTVFQAHLTDQAPPTAPSSGTLILAAAEQQGFSVAHLYDAQGNAIEITRDNLTVVRNTSGGGISKGEAVYITGATGTVPTVAKARADSAATMHALGIMYDTTANNGYGRVMLLGNIEGIDLSAFVDGDELYVSAITAGALTATAPTSPNIIQTVGHVLNNGVGNGVLFVLSEQPESSDDLGPRIADAGGTVNAITAVFTPPFSALTDKILCAVVSAGENTIQDPTFAPDGLVAKSITKNGGFPLKIGDIGPAGDVILLEYNFAASRWDLLNPANPFDLVYESQVARNNYFSMTYL